MKQPENYIKMGNLFFGIDSFLKQAATFKKVNFGLVTNNVATTSTGILSRTALLKAGFNITKLFSPEHGLTATGEDGSYQSNSIDSLSQLPIISLYGKHLMPSAADMANVDMVLFDIPDVGSRFYTYLWTMTYVMEACANLKKPFIILDRPNPISGNIKKAEGPMLDEKNCSSFLGRWNIPVRHSCTLGELATYFAATRKIDIDLTVFQLTNWNRNQLANDNNWSFTPTSPAIVTIETALCYPGTGLLEGININEGRGTNTPFTVFGAPWINDGQFVNKMIENKLPGVRFLETQYTPSKSLYAGQCCHGLSLSITDENIFLPVQTGIVIIQQLLFLFPEQCSERLYKTVANPTGEKHLDKLLGVENSFSKLRDGNKISTELNDKWEVAIAPFLLYH
jgi:uncharacterized protein YbbC (DUF1343 family)